MAGHSYDWPYLGHTVVRPLHVGGGDDDDNSDVGGNGGYCYIMI